MSDVNTFKIIVRNYTGAIFELVGLEIRAGRFRKGTDLLIPPARFGECAIWEFAAYDNPSGEACFALHGDHKICMRVDFHITKAHQHEIGLWDHPLGQYLSITANKLETDCGDMITYVIEIKRFKGAAIEPGDN